MSELGTGHVTIKADAREADRTVREFLRKFQQAIVNIKTEADTRKLKSSIEAAVADARARVAPTPDTQQLTKGIEGAVDAADTQVTPTADTGGMTKEIEGAADAADTQVTPTVDGSEVTKGIDGAVDAADTHVKVTADASGMQNLEHATGRVAEKAEDAKESLVSLENIVRGGFFAVAAKQIFDMAQAASDLAESQSKAQQVFHDSTGVVTEFADKAATSIGLATQQATEMAGTFGNLFTSMGLGRDVAADMSTEVLQLGADLASFNNLGVDETLEKIRAGIIGEIEPLRSLGINFNAAQVEAKALELGLAGASGEVSESAKVQARLALITEQASNASGDFARTSEGLANQQRIVRAEFQNAIVDIGQGFLPLILELVQAARSDLIPALTELGTTAAPALSDALIAVVPLLGTTTRLLTAATPLLEALATVVETIPDPVLQMAGAWLLFGRAIGPIKGLAGGVADKLGAIAAPAGAVGGAVGRTTAQVTAMQSGLRGLLGQISPTTLAIGALAVGFTLWSDAQQREKDISRDVEAQTKSFTTTLSSAEDAIEGVTEALHDAFAAGEGFTVGIENARGKVEVTSETLADAGLNAESFAKLVAKGADDVNNFALRLLGANEEGLELSIGLTGLSDQMQDAAEATLDAEVAMGTYNQSQVDAAVATATGSGEAKNYFGALQTLKTEVEANAAAAEDHAAEQEKANEALRHAAEVTPGLAEAMRHLKVPGHDATDEFRQLAIVLSQSDLSAEEMQAIAESLGVSLDDLGPHVEAVRGLIENLQATAGGAVPGIDDIASQIDDLSKLSAPQLTETLSTMLQSVSSFNDNIELVMRERPLLSGIAAQAPEFAQLIADMIRGGNTKMLEQWELLVAGIDTEAGQLPDIIDQNSPEFVAAMEALGLAGVTGYEENYKPSGSTQTEMNQAKLNIAAAKEGIKTASKDVAEASTSEFSAALDISPVAKIQLNATEQAYRAAARPHREAARDLAKAETAAYFAALKISPVAVAELDKTEDAYRAAQAPHKTASGAAARGARDSYRGGLTPVSTDARDIMVAAKDRIRQSRDQMTSAGKFSGGGGASGFRSGLDIPKVNLDQVVKKWRTNIIAGIGEFFESGSPSRLMMRQGRWVAEGFVKGIVQDDRKWTKLVSAWAAKIGAAFGPGAGSGVLRWREVALAALRYTGQSASWVGDLLTQMAHESGGNQFAINTWDINAQRGDPSRGLMQTIGSTFRAYARELAGRGIYDPFANIVAAIRYTLSRYGSLGVWRARGFKGYETGVWKLLEDQLAGLHRGEMVVPARPAEVLRAVVEGGPRQPRGGGVNIEQLVINVPADVTDPFAFGRKIRRGFESTLAGRRVMVDARLAG